MRRYAKIAVLVILPVAGVGLGPCNAQTVVSARASVTVTVVSGISASSPAALDFGQLSEETGNIKLNPWATNGTDLIISGPPARMVCVTFPSKTTLRNADGDLLSFIPEIGWTAPNTRSSDGTAALDTGEGSAMLSIDGPLFIKFGGSINAEGGAKGSYRGSYSITVVY